MVGKAAALKTPLARALEPPPGAKIVVQHPEPGHARAQPGPPASLGLAWFCCFSFCRLGDVPLSVCKRATASSATIQLMQPASLRRPGLPWPGNVSERRAGTPRHCSYRRCAPRAGTSAGDGQAARAGAGTRCPTPKCVAAGGAWGALGEKKRVEDLGLELQRQRNRAGAAVDGPS